jgi:hypothetical protein
MPRPSFGFALAAVVSVAAGVALAQEATVKPIASVRQIMQTMTVPFSDAIFGAASEPPKTVKEWTALRGTAIALAESGNLLMIGPRARDKAEWMKMARSEVDAAEAVMKAIDTRDGDKLSAAGDALYETCENCHNRYMKPSAPTVK